MSLTPSSPARTEVPDTPRWFWDLLAVDSIPGEGETVRLAGREFLLERGIPRSAELHSDSQQQTSTVFGFKWRQRDMFESEASRNTMREWANRRYGAVTGWISPHERAVVLDAGCGAAYTALEYFQPLLDRIRYLGVDISSAVDIARERLAETSADAAFLQCNLTHLPLLPASVDVIFSEGVLHHTDSTEGALKALASLLRPGGLFMFYVYRKKGPIREFTDDYIRERMQDMTPEEGWQAMMSLSKLGKVLGDLDIDVEIAEPIELLDIPAGRINLQRLFYWHVFKAFYRPDYTLDEMNLINFDWYAPRNAHRQTVEEVRGWCAEAGISIEREQVEEAGITIVARRRA